MAHQVRQGHPEHQDQKDDDYDKKAQGDCKNMECGMCGPVAGKSIIGEIMPYVNNMK